MDSYRHLKGESELCDYKNTNSGEFKMANSDITGNIRILLKKTQNAKTQKKVTVMVGYFHLKQDIYNNNDNNEWFDFGIYIVLLSDLD